MSCFGNKFRKSVVEQVRVSCNEHGFNIAKKEIDEILLLSYFEYQKKLKSRQENYNQFGTMSYYEEQHKLLEMYHDLRNRSDEIWQSSLRDSQDSRFYV